jgi:DNA-binding NtrC family response regulator
MALGAPSTAYSNLSERSACVLDDELQIGTLGLPCPHVGQICSPPVHESTSANGMVRPCSCPTSKQSWQGAPKTFANKSDLQIDVNMTCMSSQLTLAQLECEHILDTLNNCNGNRTCTAKVLDISIRCLRDKIRDYVQEGIKVPLPECRNSPHRCDAHCVHAMMIKAIGTTAKAA